MRSQYTFIHIKIVLNVLTFILQYIFSGWGNEMSPEKNLHHFCFWNLPSFDFYIIILSPGKNEIFLQRRIKKFQSSLPALRLFGNIFESITIIYPASTQQQAANGQPAILCLFLNDASTLVGH